MAEHTYRLHWLDGGTQEVCGPDPATAMNNAGIGHGALRALDYYETVATRPDEADRLRALNAELLAALDPDTLEAIADEIECFEHSARAGSLRVIARQQRAVIAKARGEA